MDRCDVRTYSSHHGREREKERKGQREREKERECTDHMCPEGACRLTWELYWKAGWSLDISYTVFPGRSDKFYIVGYYTKWVTTSLTHSSTVARIIIAKDQSIQMFQVLYAQEVLSIFIKLAYYTIWTILNGQERH